MERQSGFGGVLKNHRLRCSCGKNIRMSARTYIGAQIFEDSYLLCFNCKCGSTRAISMWESEPVLAERLSARSKLMAHGEGTRSGALSAEYMAWRNMRNRCSNPKATHYAEYGGRGIRVCEHWSVYVNFLADMGRKPTPVHTLERIDNNRGYEPGNCTWATRKEQRANRRDSRFYEFRGERLCLKDIADLCGLKRQTLEHRMRAGWTLEKATNAPLRHSTRGVCLAEAGDESEEQPIAAE